MAKNYNSSVPAQLAQIKEASSILASVLENAGSLDYKSLSDRVAFVTKQVSKMTDEIYTKLGKPLPTDSKDQYLYSTIRRSLSANLSSLVNQENFSQKDLEAISKVIVDNFELIEPLPETIFEDLPRVTDKSIAEAFAMSNFIDLKLKFDKHTEIQQKAILGDTSENIFKSIKELVINQSQKIATKIATDPSNELIVYKSILGSNAQLFKKVVEKAYEDRLKELLAAVKEPDKIKLKEEFEKLDKDKPEQMNGFIKAVAVLFNSIANLVYGQKSKQPEPQM